MTTSFSHHLSHCNPNSTTYFGHQRSQKTPLNTKYHPESYTFVGSIFTEENQDHFESEPSGINYLYPNHLKTQQNGFTSDHKSLKSQIYSKLQKKQTKYLIEKQNNKTMKEVTFRPSRQIVNSHKTALNKPKVENKTMREDKTEDKIKSARQFHERQDRALQNRKTKVETLLKLKQIQADKECTFKPNLITFKPSMYRH